MLGPCCILNQEVLQMHRMKRIPVVLLALAQLAACQPPTPPPGAIQVDASFPWKTCDKDNPAAVTSIRADPGNPKKLIVGLDLTSAHRKALVCISVQQLPQFQGRTASLVNSFIVTFTFDDHFARSLYPRG